MALHVLHRGGRSDEARALQAATNRRLRSRGAGALAIKEDGSVGAKTLTAVARAAYLLGAQKATCDGVRQLGVIPIGVQRMVRNPGRRSDKQVELGRARMAQVRTQRHKRAEAAKAELRSQRTSARARAVNAFLAHVGTVEHPPGSNGGGLISTMQAYWGFGRVPWCGVAAGYHAERFGGVNLQSDVAAVAAIERHARRIDSPYGKWQSDPRGALPGSFVVIGGSGVHVGMLVEALANGSAKTVEGNTSFGPGGSQSNGGCIAARVRSPQEVYGVATMHYPTR